MFRTSPDLPQKSFQIKQDDKFFSRLMSKENSMAHPSFRVYYGAVSVAVPFMWESQPGTPKYTFCESTVTPLTPPPSHYSNSNKKPTKNHSRSNLLHMLFPRINLKKTCLSTLPSSSSTLSPTPSSASWSSLNSSTALTPTPRKCNERSRISSRGSSFDSRAYDDEEPSTVSPTSTLCFGISRGTCAGLRGCYSWSS